jgi:hypothetical protein
MDVLDTQHPASDEEAEVVAALAWGRRVKGVLLPSRWQSAGGSHHAKEFGGVSGRFDLSRDRSTREQIVQKCRWCHGTQKGLQIILGA